MILTYTTNRKYIYQTDPEFASRPSIKPSGCYFMSIIEASTAYLRFPFTHKSVIEFYDKEINDGDTDVDNEMFVGNPQNLVDDLVGKGKIKFLGIRDSLYVCKDDEFEINCWHKTGHSYNHFVHGNGKGITLYDPWGPNGSDSVSDGSLLSKRIYAVM